MDRPGSDPATPGSGRAVAGAGGAQRAWRAVWWFGFVLAIVGSTDLALIFYPWNGGTPAWEFAVVGQMFSGLPLLTMAMAALLAAAFALRSAGRLRVLGGVMLALATLLAAGFVLYLLSAPVVLRSAPPDVTTGLYKALIKTIVFAAAFIGLYVAAGMAAFRFASTRKG